MTVTAGPAAAPASACMPKDLLCHPTGLVLTLLVCFLDVLLLLLLLLLLLSLLLLVEEGAAGVAVEAASASKLLEDRTLLLVPGGDFSLLPLLLAGLSVLTKAGGRGGATSKPSSTRSKDARGSASAHSMSSVSLSVLSMLDGSLKAKLRSCAGMTLAVMTAAAAMTGSEKLPLLVLQASPRDSPVIASAWLMSTSCAGMLGAVSCTRPTEAGGGMPIKGSSSCSTGCVVLTRGRGTGPFLKDVLISAEHANRQSSKQFLTWLKNLEHGSKGGLG